MQNIHEVRLLYLFSFFGRDCSFVDEDIEVVVFYEHSKSYGTEKIFTLIVQDINICVVIDKECSLIRAI